MMKSVADHRDHRDPYLAHLDWGTPQVKKYDIYQDKESSEEGQNIITCFGEPIPSSDMSIIQKFLTNQIAANEIIIVMTPYCPTPQHFLHM